MLPAQVTARLDAPQFEHCCEGRIPLRSIASHAAMHSAHRAECDTHAAQVAECASFIPAIFAGEQVACHSACHHSRHFPTPFAFDSALSAAAAAVASLPTLNFT